MPLRGRKKKAAGLPGEDEVLKPEPVSSEVGAALMSAATNEEAAREKALVDEKNKQKFLAGVIEQAAAVREANPGNICAKTLLHLHKVP